MPGLTETLIALGAADRLVGIGRYDPPVPERPDVPRVGDAFSVSLETLLALEPDAVLVNGVGLAERLQPIAGRTRVLVIPTDTIADVLDAVERLGVLAGREAAARALDTELRLSMKARVRERDGPRPRVLVVVQRRPFYVAGAGSYIGELLEMVGAENAAGDIAEPWPQISEESLVAARPDVILDASLGSLESRDGMVEVLGEWQRLRTIPAVESGRVHVLGAESEALFRAGPRLPAALDLLETLLFAPDRPR